MAKLYQAQSELRFFGEPYSRVEMASQLQSNALVAPFIDQAPQAETWYLCSRTFDNGLNDKMIVYFEDAINAVNNNEEQADALETAEAGVAQLLSQYGLATMVTRWSMEIKKAILRNAAPETAAECDRLKEVNAELLEACKMLVGYHWHNDLGVKPPEYHTAKAAIAKATT